MRKFQQDSAKKYNKQKIEEISTDIVKNKFINHIKNKMKSGAEPKFIKYTTS